MVMSQNRLRGLHGDPSRVKILIKRQKCIEKTATELTTLQAKNETPDLLMFPIGSFREVMHCFFDIRNPRVFSIF